MCRHPILTIISAPSVGISFGGSFSVNIYKYHSYNVQLHVPVLKNYMTKITE